MTTIAYKQQLIKMLSEKSFIFDTDPIFKLSSGRFSNFYIDCKPVTLDPYGMIIVGLLVYNEIKQDNVQGVGGLTFGADPISIATSFMSGTHSNPIKAFSIRKERKNYGSNRCIEGSVKPGDRVVIIDDVATTGGSTIKAIEQAKNYELEIVKVVILFDRQEGGVDNIKQYIPNVITITNKDELMKYNSLRS